MGSKQASKRGGGVERESTCEVGLCDTYRRWIRFLLDPLLPANAQSLTPTCYPQFLAAGKKQNWSPNFCWASRLDRQLGQQSPEGSRESIELKGGCWVSSIEPPDSGFWVGMNVRGARGGCGIAAKLG